MKLIAIALPGILTAMLFAEPAYAQDAKDDPSGNEDSFSQDAAAADPLGKDDSNFPDAATDPLGKDDASAQDTAQDTPAKNDPSAQDGSFFGGLVQKLQMTNGGGFNPMIAEPEPKKSVRILRLVQLEPHAVAETLKQLFQNDIAVTAYAKTNTLVIYGTEEQIQQAEKLVEMLDQPEEKQQMKADYADMYNPMDPMARMMKRSSPDAEQQSLNLAEQYRTEAKNLKADHPRLKQLESQLQKAVATAFQVRQERQWAELQQLEQKVHKMKNLVEARNRIKSEIIDRRVADLKNPHRVWEQSQRIPGSNSLLGGPGPGVLPLGSPIGLAGPAKLPRTGSDQLPGIVGTVLGIDHTRQVIEISIGSSDGVTSGMELRVSNPMNQTIGEVEVTQIQNRRSSARILSTVGRNKIVIGDRVNFVETSAPLVQGVITAISSKDQLIELSLGANDGLKLNTTLQVWRDKTYLGEIEVIELLADKSMARITKDQPNAPMQKGDRVLNDSSELESLLRTWSERSAKVRNLEGRLHRFIYDKVFHVEKRAEGVFYYEAPGKFRIELQPAKIAKDAVSRKRDQAGRPYTLQSDRQDRLMCDGKDVWLVNDGIKTIDVFPLPHDNPVPNFLRDLKPLLFGIPSAEARQSYQFALLDENEEEATIQVSPRSQKDAAQWQKATVILDKKLYLPRAVRWLDAGGNLETVYTFDGIQTNQTDASRPQAVTGEEPNLFRPKLPGYKIKRHEPQEKASERPRESESAVDKPISSSVQLKLAKPETATFLWTPDETTPSQIVILPARINVPATKAVMFQIDNLDGHPNLMLFGTFTNQAETPAAKTYAVHNAVNIQFTDEDINQASLGNLLTKVYYLPKNDMAEAAIAGGSEELVSSRLDPGLDPVAEAKKRGDLLGILRLGNRHSDIGKNEDWHEKFLRNNLKAIEAERDSVKEDLLFLENLMLDRPNLTAARRALLDEKIPARKAELAGLEERRELYLKERTSHAEKSKSTDKSAKP